MDHDWPWCASGRHRRTGGSTRLRSVSRLWMVAGAWGRDWGGGPLGRTLSPEVVTPEKPRWLVTCSCGWSRECISRWAAESVSQAERAGCHAHRYGRGAAGRGQGRATTDADLAGYTEGTGCPPTHPAIARTVNGVRCGNPTRPPGPRVVTSVTPVPAPSDRECPQFFPVRGKHPANTRSAGRWYISCDRLDGEAESLP